MMFLGAAGTPEKAAEWLSHPAFKKMNDAQRDFVLNNQDAFAVRDPKLFPEGRLDVLKPGFTERYYALSLNETGSEADNG